MESKNNLPQEIVHRLTDPLNRFIKIQAAAGGVLLLATIVSVILANSNCSESFHRLWEIPIGIHFGSFELSHSLHRWINDGLMTLFFFVVALELKREMVLGELRNLRMALLPLAGAVGGMLFPALFYLGIMRDQPEVPGWGIVMATDTAFVIGCLSILGSRIPSNLRLFLLSLAIFDDLGAILVVAFGYGSSINWLAFGLGVIGFGVVAGVTRIGIRTISVYSMLGIAIWLCFEASGVHPTLVGVCLGLMTPTAGWISDELLRSILNKVLSYPTGDHWSGDTVDRHDLRKAGTAARETLSPVERLTIWLHPWVGFLILPLFALANAGVLLSQDLVKQPVSLAIIFALVCGKPLGVLSMSWISVRLGFATLLPDLNWRLIAAGSALTGIGFTMSLFIAGLAFSSPTLDAAKIGIITASVISAALGMLSLTLITSSSSAGSSKNL